MNIYFYFFLLLLVVFTGCRKNLLELNNPNAIKESIFYSDTKQIDALSISLYDGLQKLPLREFALLELRTDNARTRTKEGDFGTFEQFNVSPTSAVVKDYWKNNYSIIQRANLILAHLNAVTLDSIRNNYEAQARFVRALAHFNLVRAFGDVPIIDTVISAENTSYFVRKPTNEVYNFIINDLDKAQNLFLVNAPLFGKVTKFATKGILAKVYLTVGRYTEALTLLNEIIGSGRYGLQSNYSNVFTTEQNNEIIFAIQYVPNSATESQDFSKEMSTKTSGVVAGGAYLTEGFINMPAFSGSDARRATTVVTTTDAYVEANNCRKYYTTVGANSGNDWIVLRYSDILLMKAEAILAGSDATTNSEAITAFTTVRKRGLSSYSEPSSLTKDMLLDERRIEFVFENQRLFDLIRFGKAESVLYDYAKSLNYNFTKEDLLLPIPQSEIDVTKGLLIQNKGY